MPQRPIAHDDSESELDYNDISDLDNAPVAGISSTTTQSSASVQGGDMEIIRSLQLENQSLKNNNRTLGEKNKILASNQHRRSSAQVPDELKAYDVELSTFAHKYGVIAEMFPPEHRVLRLLVPNPPPMIISASRYASKSAEELCLVTEVYSLLPDHLHCFVPTSHFQSLLEQHLQGGRSSEIGKLRLMAGRIFGLDSSYFDLCFMKQDTIPEIQKMLGPGTTGARSSPSKFPPILFANREMDPTMSTVFGNWEPLAKAIRIVMFGKNSLDISGWPRAKCNAQKWGTTSCTPGLLAWGWVALIFILSPDTSFAKAGVGAKSRLPHAAMFTAYKQLWVSLWDQPRICLIRKKIDAYVWQSSSTSNVATSDAEGEDFTSDLMCLAITNAGCKESDFPGPTTDNIPGTTTDNTSDIPRPVTPISPIVIPAASASALTPGPAVPVIVPAAPAIPVLGPAKTTTAPDPNPTILLPAQPTPTVASAGVVQGAAAVAVTAALEFPPAAAEVLPNDVEILPAVAAAPSSGRRGRGRQAGMLAPVSSGPAGQQASRPKRSRKK
ncbi:hypothetical protein DEU56DRAFT_917456 [Suillus clintonianus]|uniref:uncharacterized protein n=1 Tax=Suillus clintonianus TaxID=1904413 RepID=UPI001B8717C6|nr:uncharacterized protein DEU56DRAFT_917456 [Suillus clintonianus]KAG2123408.1 hypothetical protein DEU56DRAFT_917456 [Suillus clintonianus]